MSSVELAERQKGEDAVINSEDYRYIMSTSASDLSSSPSSSKTSPRRPEASAKMPARVDNSIKPGDYKYIIETSASDESSSPSRKGLRESVGASASPSRSSHSSPRESDSGSDKPDDRCYTSPTSSPLPHPRSLTGSRESVLSSEILSSVSSDSEKVFDPFAKDHLQPRLSPREPSVDVHFPVAETVSEVSLANRSDESWFTDSRESNSFHQDALHIRKLMLDQAWVSDRQQPMSDWVSSVIVWDDDVASNLGVDSLLTRLKNRFQSTWWRLTRGRETRVQILKKSSSASGSGISGGDEDKAPHKEKLQKRVQRFMSRFFICGGPSQA
ncbi:uncharacterized protein LOC124112385 [Haliotis rufescens]|uniref:uncharacterized protein LOC124112385 n=1 Tax=Haliotis rufescens TaxID=6454 RepID=UPI00201F421B|nr:uncharacterized protein LOC124112385 [Haliotis rufescens]